MTIAKWLQLNTKSSVKSAAVGLSGPSKVEIQINGGLLLFVRTFELIFGNKQKQAGFLEEMLKLKFVSK